MKRKYTVLAGSAFFALTLFAVWQTTTPQPQTTSEAVAGGAIAAVQSPLIDGNAAIGKAIFDKACASCHGENAAGTNGLAPPLVHKIYEPSHHADEAFQRAAKLGVKSHHWPFGDMPPVQGLTRGDVTMVVAYIRTLQRANGIH
ncbi:c-type cytochrome [Parasedimentitalea psychrophila]|uniref:Cytochrome c n=1 Tax=Parasedimentitalea psychrophila TaxID=2997337 RepID=A0A9Y2KZK1_9RHOB|nr:cytochrome c [Parasedimentitalea psychrophila]WIY24079.1 cytochrome c [Parasedimentitalea psychrophila]